MEFVLQPWQLLLACLAGWINQEQQKMIDYLKAENRILKEKFGKKRILLNDKQRRILAVKGKSLRKKMLQEIGAVFTPDTILRWHKQLIAQKWDYSNRRESQAGCPRIRQEIVNLTVRMAQENPGWGYKKILCVSGKTNNLEYVFESPLREFRFNRLYYAFGVENEWFDHLLLTICYENIVT